jgi:hypothetical protein
VHQRYIMRVLILLLSLMVSTYGHPQANSKPGPSDSAIVKKVRGNIKQFMRWTDHLGDNYLVLTVTDEIKSPAKTSDKELFGYHFIRKDSLIWQLNDFEKACSFDNIVEFRNGATKITDLDNNGLSEIWIMYSLACTSDASPRTLKLIMYQGNKKYAIRGTSQPAKNMTDEKNGGKYILSKEFESLPQSFKDFAQKLWARYLYDLQ